MWNYFPDLLERAVPRYTSYPTAAEFHDGVGAAEMHNALAGVEQGEALSVYVHIPYCQSICWYCGCNTGAANKSRRLTSYLEALEAEIGQIGRRLGGRGKIRRIAFGGGSPNAIPPVDFVRLVDRLVTVLRCENPDISVELDPRLFTKAWGSMLASAGVRRVSLGVQSFSPAIQQAIGREQSLETITRCVSQLRTAGIAAINFDLMYGLPGQTFEDMEDTLEKTISLAPSRIALFGYAHMPHLFPRQRRIDGAALPDAEARFTMAAIGHDRLVAAGYVPIGFDHFALPNDSLANAAATGKLRRNFQGFTDDDSRALIGIGASAISQFDNAIIQNEKNPGRYRMLLSGGQLSAARGVLRNADDRERGAIIEAILCTGTSPTLRPALAAAARLALALHESRGLIRWEGNAVLLQPEATPYARAIAAEFDEYRGHTSGQFSNAI